MINQARDAIRDGKNAEPFDKRLKAQLKHGLRISVQ